MKITWKTLAPLVIWLAIYLVPVPAGLNANQWHYFAIFAAVIAGLILESMPVGAVGLIGLTVAGVIGLCRARSQQIAALDAGRLFRKHGVADRRRLRVLDRLPQERPRPPARLDAGARPRPPHHRPRLCGGLLRPGAGAGDAVQHRAFRRHDLSDRQQYPAHLRLRARAHRRQDRHLCDVDGVRDHRRHQFAVPDRAGAECGGAVDRQEDRQRRGRLVAMVHRLRAARNPAAAAGAAVGLCRVPARGEGEPGNRHLERGRTRRDGAAVAQRMDHGGAGAAGDVPVDLRLQSHHQPSAARVQLHQPDHGGLRRDLADAADRRDRLRRHRPREERRGRCSSISPRC